MPKISIVIPVQNAQTYLRGCLDSVVGQTLEDIEVLCVDDHSDDASPATLREYAERDHRVRVITFSENKSASQARKDGVLASTGEYVMFLDADDSLELDACERLYAAMKADPVDILHFGTTIEFVPDLPSETLDWVQSFVKPYDGALQGRDILKGAFAEARLYNFSIWDKLYSAELCRKAFSHIQDGGFPKAQDKYAYFLLAYFAQTYRGVPNEALYRYHFGRGVTGQSLLSLAQFERYCSMALVADALRNFLVEEGTLARDEALYRNARNELLQDCVATWDRSLDAVDRAAGLKRMLAYWEPAEVVATISKLVEPKISVIIPVHNMHKYLRESLDSVVGQTLPDIEVICVDDHSDDASPDILREYAERDSRVRVITYPENRSVSQARKDAVLTANGEYVMFLDADDSIELDACERLYEEVRENPVDILHFGTAITNEMNLTQERITWLRGFIGPYYGELEGSSIFEACFASDSLYNFSIWDKLYSAELCKKSFARIKDGNLPRGEDKYAYVVLSYFAQTYRGVPEEVIYNYNFGRGGTGHQLLSFSQFEKTCALAFSADAIGDFLAEEGALERYALLHDSVRSQLLLDCVANWNKHLAPQDKAAGFDLMLACWKAPEVIAKIAEMNWVGQGHIAHLLAESQSVVREPREVRVVGTYYHRYGNGGAERNLSILIRMWLDLGYKVVLFTDLPPSSDDYELPDGVERVVLPSFFEVKADNYRDRASEFDKAIKEHGIDVMVYHAWVSPILLWDLLLCKAAGVAFITHCHSVFAHLARSVSPYFADMPAIYHLCDAVVTLSEVDRAYWRNFNHNVTSVVNPLSFNLEDLEVAKLESKNLLWLGRISNEKRLNEALRIFAKVLEEEREAKLFIVGSCPDKTYMDGLYVLMDELGVRDAVVMCGFHKDVLPFYGMASVLLMTSESEGFSLVLAEAQSAGVPCVMYELPYLTLTRPRKGFIAVELGDLDAAADAVVELLQDPEYRGSVGREARANIEEMARFDFSGTWRAVFDSLAQPAGGRPVDETSRIMWETLMEHYRAGAVQRNLESAKRDREISAVRGRAARGDQRIRQLEKKVATAKSQQKKLRKSAAFRVGRAITAVPRAIRKALQHLTARGGR